MKDLICLKDYWKESSEENEKLADEYKKERDLLEYKECKRFGHSFRVINKKGGKRSPVECGVKSSPKCLGTTPYYKRCEYGIGCCDISVCFKCEEQTVV